MKSVRSTRKTPNQLEKCPQCNALVNPSMRHCATCESDLGFPNVRAAQTVAETKALLSRYTHARGNAVRRNLSVKFDELVLSANAETHVIVSMPLLFARSFLADSKMLYRGYEGLVGERGRVPAKFEDDSDRFTVSAKLFASYAHEIRYGLLSFDGVGLANYGPVFVKLRDAVIEKRVSFLNENSYHFVDRHRLSTHDEVPPGYRATWQNRAELVATKLEPMLAPTSILSVWAHQLVVQGATRAKDECIEAHIFGTFNANSVESIEFASKNYSRAEQNDIRCIKELRTKQSRSGVSA